MDDSTVLLYFTVTYQQDQYPPSETARLLGHLSAMEMAIRLKYSISGLPKALTTNEDGHVCLVTQSKCLICSYTEIKRSR